MKLYELKDGAEFVLTVDAYGPPDIGEYPSGTKLKLHNIDGMYSYCTDENKKIYHVCAWAEVEPL